MDEPTSHDAQPDPGVDPTAGRDPRDPATQASDLEGAARANLDATWGADRHGDSRLPWILTGELGPKGRISAQLRGLSRHERSTHGQVMRGTTTPGTGRYLLGFILLALLALVGILALFLWLVAG